MNRLRSGLEAVDIMAASSDTLRGLLLQTVSIHVYLRCDEVGDEESWSICFSNNIR